MITKEQVEYLVQEKISGTEIFLVEVKIHPGNQVNVQIDKPQGISIEECVEVSRHILANIDREIEDYNLEVSSPGLSAPFKVREQYLKNTGKNVEVLMNDGSKYNGKLLNYTEQETEIEIQVKENNKSKKLINEIIALNNADIKTVKVIISFK